MLDPLSYSNVVFDWNGTLVDDVSLAVGSVNAVRAELGLPSVSLAEYRRHFRFPIRAFYQDLGFDFERTSFETLVEAYLGHFDPGVVKCDFCPGAFELVMQLKTHGVEVAVLSASHQKTLIETAERNELHGQIDHFFGLEDSAASGKLDRARDLDRHMRRPDYARVLMIGDTDHDAEVASDRGWDFLAVATGHQDAARLHVTGAPVVQTLRELVTTRQSA
jgi:phosphoglycolate phosphatase